MAGNDCERRHAGITDDSMIAFLETAGEVFDSVRADMASLCDELRDHENVE